MSEDKPKMAMVLLHQSEVMCLIIEHLTGLERPEGMTAEQAVDNCSLNKDVMAMVASAATAILDYVTGEIGKSGAATVDKNDGGMH
jgi:hypothetical protein